tara:strand:- start:222 stop:455 length:234 start_codon:yes stop_codon:yes gene_type:complete
MDGNIEYKVRIPEVDKILKEANDKYVQIVSSDNTPEEVEEMKLIDNKLVSDVNYVNSIINQVLEYLEARGCETSEYI